MSKPRKDDSIRTIEAPRQRAEARDGWLQRYVPITSWLSNYNRADLPSDAIAGSVVAIMLIPQAMAYAMLAGLPPQMGLYASILPLIAYAVLGTSRTLGVGPVAIVSLMISSSLTPFAEAGSPQYISYAIMLALMSGAILLILGMLRAGAITNFMSHPVVAGFSTAAALVIAASQLNHLLGLDLERTHLIPKTILEIIREASEISAPTVAIGFVSLVVLLGRNKIAAFLKSANLISPLVADLLPKAMPLVVVIVATGLTWGFDLAQKGVKIVGSIPSGLPGVVIPDIDLKVAMELAPVAMIVAAVAFLESISIARTLAAKRREKLSPDQELIGLGTANIMSAATGGYPIAGSFSRSSVNFSSGARTQLAAIITAVLIALALLLLTPLLYHLPRATLAAIVVMAVTGLVDFSPLAHTWRYMKLDAISYAATFLGVLILGVEEGIFAGIISSIVFFLWRTSKPDFVVLGRLGESQIFRDARFHEVHTYPDVLFLRVDMSLYFANANNLEDVVLRQVAENPQIKHFVLVCSSINMIDASALDSLSALRSSLHESGVTMHLAAVKMSILRRMKATDFLDQLNPGKVFTSAHDAAAALVTEITPSPVPDADYAARAAK
jgi:SulP family sulfate permease